MSKLFIQRRTILQTAPAIASGLALPAWLATDLVSARSLVATPSQTEGPFYPDQALADSDYDLLRNGNAAYQFGEAVWIAGVVTDLEGRPVHNAIVEAWQCDHEGHYRHSQFANQMKSGFQGFGKTTTDKAGTYRFRTIKPVPYGGRPPHVHFKVKLGKRELLTTQMYLRDDPSNQRDGILRRLSAQQRALLEVEFIPTNDGLVGTFNLRVVA